jgi:3-hydroxybutyrate dehydrogenase
MSRMKEGERSRGGRSAVSTSPGGLGRSQSRKGPGKKERTKQSKVAVITGGGAGIGKAIAEVLSKSGNTVVIADVNKEDGTRVASLYGGRFIYTDLSKRSECKNLVKETLRQLGSVDILINNAGFQHMGPIEDFPEDSWDQMLSVMLTAPFLLTKYAWPSMKAQNWGRIVNISSILGLVASQFKSAYVTAKTGLIGLTRATALEGGAFGITANAICPGYVHTHLLDAQITDSAHFYGIRPQDVVGRIMLEPAAIKRLVEPREIASLVRYLCSDEASAITGVALPIDLGWTAK